MQGLFNLLSKIGPLRLAAMGAVTLGMVLFFVFVMARLSTGDMKLLYADLSPQSQNAMVRELEASQIPYQIDDTRNEIKVPAAEVGRARMLLAEKGLPDGGSIGYEIFDKDSGLSSTRFDQDIRQLRALEGELVRTVSTLKPVENARVHLVLPKRELFSRDQQPASASVFLKLRGGHRLDEEQISAIQYLIAAAVPNLDPKHVSIVDQNGNLLASGRQDTGENGSAGTANIDRMRTSYEQRTAMAIEDIVGKVVGYGKVRAHVTADINYDKETTSAEIYDPEGQVARSTQSVTEDEKDSSGSSNASNVSVQNNLPGLPDGAGGGAEGRASTRNEEVTNFEISKTIKNHTREGGEVRRLSVAVLVDGTYSKSEKGETTYKARDDKELETIKSLVSSAIGFDAKRGDTLEIKNLQFVNGEGDFSGGLSDAIFMGLNKDDLFRLSETAVMGIVTLLVILLVLRPLANKLLSTPPGGGLSGMAASLGADGMPLLSGEMRAALTGPGSSLGAMSAEGGYNSGGANNLDEMIDVASVDGKIRSSSVSKVNEIIDRYPAETVSIIRSWMMQES